MLLVDFNSLIILCEQKDLKRLIILFFLLGTLFRPRSSIGTIYVSPHVNKEILKFRFSNKHRWNSLLIKNVI
jgi:hypothetical protein